MRLRLFYKKSHHSSISCKWKPKVFSVSSEQSLSCAVWQQGSNRVCHKTASIGESIARTLYKTRENRRSTVFQFRIPWRAGSVIVFIAANPSTATFVLVQNLFESAVFQLCYGFDTWESNRRLRSSPSWWGAVEDSFHTFNLEQSLEATHWGSGERCKYTKHATK